MNIMRLAVYDKAKDEFNNVHLTYGYVTKHTRINNGVVKSHNADAFCIAKNMQAERMGNYLKIRLLKRHSRALHVYNPKSGGIRRSAVASHWIGDTNLQKYYTVKWKGVICFVAGSTNGRPIIRDIDGKQIALTQYVNYRILKFVKRNKGFLIKEYKNV